MSDQPEALRLVDEIDTEELSIDRLEKWIAEAAAELRRQHDEIEQLKAERDALKTAAEKGTEYVLAQINQDLKAERDALLSALQEIVEDQEKFRICCGESLWRKHDDKCWVPKAKAAINAIRGDK